jgi:hypothetical protein
MHIRTSTTLVPAGKVRAKTTTRVAPMLPALRISSTFSVVPTPTCSTQFTNFLQWRFRALLTDGAREVSFERVTTG